MKDFMAHRVPMGCAGEPTYIHSRNIGLPIKRNPSLKKHKSFIPPPPSVEFYCFLVEALIGLKRGSTIR